jgi:hypothetical protein
MPIIPPPTPTVPFDTADTILNLARARLNDTILSAAGNLLADTQNYTFTLLNGAWRHLQEDLANAGTCALIQEVVLQGFPVVGSTDPSSQAFLNQQYYFDGQNYWIPPDVGLLPQDLILPLRIWERQTQTNQIFTQVSPTNDGLPDLVKTNRNRVYEWRNNSIYMPGANIVVDFRIRYASYLPDIAANGTAQVPILRCSDALAHYVCAEFAYSRGSPEAVGVGNSFMGMGQAAMKRMLNREARQQQRGNHRKIGYSKGRHWGWGNW